MRTVIRTFEAVVAFSMIWAGYNMLVFAEIAAGRHMEYVPYLHFPIKVFVWLFG